MNGPASKDFIQPVEQATEQVHRRVQSNLRVVGHEQDTKPAAEGPIPFSQELRDIGVNAAHIVGVNYHEIFTGEGEQAKVRESDNKGVVSKIREAFLRKKAA